MTTQSWSFPVDHQNDAGFRAWGADFNARLAAIGLVQTADTGQIDWATVTRPVALSTTAGYEIWRFDDTQQSNAPIYLKFEYGTGSSSATHPRILVSIGTGSDGVGALSGVLVNRLIINAGRGSATGASVQSFFCHVDGFLGLYWGRDAAGSGLPYAAFVLCRSCDASGTPTDRAAFFAWTNNATSYNTGAAEVCGANGSVNFDTGTAFFSDSGGAGAQPSCCLMPGHTGASSVNEDGDICAYPWFGADPHPFPLFALCCVWNSEVSPTGTFSATLIGETPRTFINLGNSGFAAPMPSNIESQRSSVGHCMLWE